MKSLKDRLFLVFVKLVLVWCIFAISFDIFMAVTQFASPELNRKVGNEIMWAIDGTFHK